MQRVTDYFDCGWRQAPDAIAFIADDRSFTYDEVGTLSCQVANALIRDGLQTQTPAAVLSTNDVTAWACVLGIWRAGLAWVPLNPSAVPTDTADLIARFDVEVVFFGALFGAVVDQLRPNLQKVKHWICLEDDLSGWISGASEVPPDVSWTPDDPVGISPTGGTTGASKGVVISHRNIVASMTHLEGALDYIDGRKPVNLAAAPMTHSAGLLTLPTSARGGTVVVLTRPDPTLMFQHLAKHQVTELFLPPTVIYRLLEWPGVNEADFSSLRYFMYGAAPMSVEKLKRAMTVFGPVMMGSYGQTEAPLTIATLTPAEHVGATDERLSSVGRPGHLIEVTIRSDDDEVLPIGEAGEICVRGDLVMTGYYQDPQQTAMTIVDGWLRTGDVGHLDQEGYLTITDRKKDMIITGGFNVYPSRVEQVLWRHPAVEDCAVIGVPDEEWGERVTAVVQLASGAQVSEAELRAVCRHELGGVATPKDIVFMQNLPRSANGKVLKRELRDQWWTGRERRV